MLVSIIGQISVIVGTILFRPIIVILHELGHAIPALVFTKGKVIINIGDIIDEGNNWTLEFSRSKFIFNYRKLFLGGGFVTSDVNDVEKWQYVIIILGGPLFSFFVGLVSFYLSMYYDIHGALKIIFLFILCLALFDFMAILKRKYQ